MAGKDDFFDEQSEASGVKARIISAYFDTWSSIVWKEAKRLGQKIAYMDMYCGPGRYGDNSKSTPILVLEKAIAKPDLHDLLITIFNDEDPEHIKKLTKEIGKIQGIKKLREPQILNEKVGKEVEEYFLKNSTYPTFTFIDPFGYVGLTRGLIEGVTKNWGCDCIFFFNYDRINRALSTSIFTPRMEAIFGKERATKLEAQMQEIKGSNKGKPQLREEIIVDTLTEALGEVHQAKGHEVYVRPFRFKKGKRTSHMLVFVTKHPLGYRVMNELMAGEGYKDSNGIPTYTYYDDPPPHENKLPLEMEALKDSLLRHFAGRTETMIDIYKEHVLRRDYILPNYKEALRQLEKSKRITADPSAKDRRVVKGVQTFADAVKVTFPEKK